MRLELGTFNKGSFYIKELKLPMKHVILSITGFFLLAFTFSWSVNQFFPAISWHHIDVKEILTGLGPAISGSVCYRLFATPNSCKLSLTGNKPLIVSSIVIVSIVLPVLLTNQVNKSAFTGRVLTQFAYTMGEEFGWRHYLQNVTNRLNKWQQSLLVGFVWFLWHYAILPDPTTMLTGQPIPFYIGIPVLMLFLGLFSRLLSDVVVRTQAVLLPIVIHYILKVGNGYTLIGIYILILIAYLTWNKVAFKRQSLD